MIKYNPYFIILIITLINQIEATTKSCDGISFDNLTCHFNKTCVYGEPTTADCTRSDETICKATLTCLYCWQLPEDHYVCTNNSTCKPNKRYLSTCQTNYTIACLGNREFKRYRQCTNPSGHKWSTAVVLSILFGGFGVDRFYLGHWQEGVGKLFSFGGFGVWTLIDAILISIGYLKPSDSSQYD